MADRRFFAPAHVPALPDLARSLGADARAIARHLEVAERTVYHWQATGKTPRAAALALFWETHEGRALIADHEQRGQAIFKSYAESLERENATLRTRIARLEAIADFGCANAPTVTSLVRGAAPLGLDPVAQLRHLADDPRGQ